MVLIGNEIPRNLGDRTGIHICVRCLREVRPEEYYRNDHVCGTCAEQVERYPLASSPGSVDGASSSETGGETGSVENRGKTEVSTG